MKKALIITWEKYQDHELIYPYYSLKEHGYEVDIMAKNKTYFTNFFEHRRYISFINDYFCYIFYIF